MAIKRIFYGLMYGFLALLIAVGLALTAVKFWVLPNIGQWKQPIAERLGDYLGTRVEIGGLQARWRGIRPEIELTEVRVYDKNHQESLSIPYAIGRLKLSSFWELRPHFAFLKVQGLSLSARRIATGQIEVLGQAFDVFPLQVDNDEFYEQLIHWLRRQGVLEINQSHLLWFDPQREDEALDLDLDSLRLSLKKEQLQIQGAVSSRREAHARVVFSSQWQLQEVQTPASAFVFPAPQGLIDIQVFGFQPSVWRRWVDLPSFLYQGRIDAQFRLHIIDDELAQARGMMQVEQPFWADPKQFISQEPQPFVHARHAEFYFELESQALAYLANLSTESPMPTYVPGARWQVRAEDLSIQVPKEFPEPLFFPRVTMHFQSKEQDKKERWYIEQLHIDSGRGQVQIKGHLTLDPDALLRSQVHLQGNGEQVDLSTIYRYFPLSLDADLRAWLQDGLIKGSLNELRFDWQGPIEDFEYYQHSKNGNFKLQAVLQDALIDYYQADESEPGWPLLSDVQALLRWQNNHLLIETKQPVGLKITSEYEIQASALQARITDLYGQADLTVQGDTAGNAEYYYALWEHSNLGALLKDTVPVQWAKGSWRVPISLGMPLALPLEEMEEAIWVRGQVNFEADASLQLWSALPPLQQLQGTLHFSAQEARLENITGQWLGGPLQVDGAIGLPNSALNLKVTPQAEALQSFYGLSALSALKGEIPARARVGLDAQDRLFIQAQSDLQGTQIELPVPLSKTRAETTWPFSFSWHALDTDNQINQVQFAVASRLAAHLVLDQENRQIRAAQLFTGLDEMVAKASAAFSDNGLRLEAHYPELDLDAWWEWLDEFSTIDDTAWSWPEEKHIRLQAQQAQVLGWSLDYFTYTQRKEAAKQWRADISSEQIAGTAVWHQQSSQKYPRGRVVARFNRFDPIPPITENKVLKDEQSDASQGETIKERVVAAKADTENVVRIRLTPSVGTDKQDETQPTKTRSKQEVQVEAPTVETTEPPLTFLPDVDLEVESFKVRGYQLGHLQLEAQGLSHALGWKISRFILESADNMHTEGQGQWRLWGDNPGLDLNGQTQFKDLGAYADYVGLEGLMQGGYGQAMAQFHWSHFPWKTDLSLLKGEASVQLEQGRLEPIRSRSAKMLELLSLQSLSRLARLDLNVTGLLKEGFPFHRIEGSAQFENAWVTTQDLQVLSPVGTLFFEGGTNMQTEKIDAQALVIPEVDMSGAALAAGMAVNPVLGFGALVAQWLLKHPMAEAMTVRYELKGDWDQYEIIEKATLSAEEKNQSGPPPAAHE